MLFGIGVVEDGIENVRLERVGALANVLGIGMTAVPIFLQDVDTVVRLVVRLRDANAAVTRSTAARSAIRPSTAAGLTCGDARLVFSIFCARRLSLVEPAAERIPRSCSLLVSGEEGCSFEASPIWNYPFAIS